MLAFATEPVKSSEKAANSISITDDAFGKRAVEILINIPSAFSSPLTFANQLGCIQTNLANRLLELGKSTPSAKVVSIAKQKPATIDCQFKLAGGAGGLLLIVVKIIPDATLKIANH